MFVGLSVVNGRFWRLSFGVGVVSVFVLVSIFMGKFVGVFRVFCRVVRVVVSLVWVVEGVMWDWCCGMVLY